MSIVASPGSSLSRGAPRLTRRALLLGFTTLAAAGCVQAPANGLRGVGTVLRSPNTHGPEPAQAGTDQRVSTSAPAAADNQAAAAPEPIVAADFSTSGGGTSEQARVIPVPSAPLGRSALPARRLVIPTIGVDNKVIQLGTKLNTRGEVVWETAPFAVGHHRGTAGPGQRGNMVLSGHISSPAEGAVFKRLPEVQVGHGVIVATEERQYLYRVDRIRTVTPDEVSVLDPTPEPIVTLITCVPDGVYSHRLVVTAALV